MGAAGTKPLPLRLDTELRPLWVEVRVFQSETPSKPKIRLSSPQMGAQPGMGRPGSLGGFAAEIASLSELGFAADWRQTPTSFLAGTGVPTTHAMWGTSLWFPQVGVGDGGAGFMEPDIARSAAWTLLTDDGKWVTAWRVGRIAALG